MFKVDLLYIIVMLMLPDGLESCRAHSHHVSVITVINFVRVFASGSLDSRIGRPFAFSKRAEELGEEGSGVAKRNGRLMILIKKKAGKLVRNLPE